MASFLADLKRKLGVQQPRQAWDKRIGASPNDYPQPIPNAPVGGGSMPQPIPNARPEPFNPQLLNQQTYSQNINPTVRPQQPAPTPRFLDNVRAAVNQPAPTPQPTLDQALMSGGPTQAEQPAQQQSQAQSQGMQRNPYRDQLTQDEAQLRALEDKKDKFWKRAVIAGINAGQAGFGYQPTQIQTGRTRDIAKTQGRIARDMKILQDTGQIDAREAAILRGQAQVDLGADRNRIAGERLNQNQSQFEQKQRNTRRGELIKQHAALTDFDPADPKNAPFVDAFTREFGYAPMRNVRGSQYGYRQGYDENGNVTAEVYNKGNGQTTGITGSNIATTEGGANRAATTDRFNKNLDLKKNPPNKQGGGGGLTPSQQGTRERMANDLVAKYNQAVSDEQDTLNNVSPSDIKPQDKAHLRSVRENLWNQIMSTYPGMFESEQPNGGGKLRPKGGGSDLTRPNYGVPTGQTQGQYAGKKFNRAKIAERAKSLGMTPAQAEKQITDGGGIVY